MITQLIKERNEKHNHLIPKIEKKFTSMKWKLSVSQIQIKFELGYEVASYLFEKIKENSNILCKQCLNFDIYGMSYSQGVHVCSKCKEDNSENDKRAFDNYIRHR